MMKNKRVIVFILVLVSVITFFIYNSNIFKKSNIYNIEVYCVGNGYGYIIKHHNMMLIKQDYIPAIQLKKTFCSEGDAKKVANMVCEKLNKKENPKITKLNLNQLQVELTCID